MDVHDLLRLLEAGLRDLLALFGGPDHSAAGHERRHEVRAVLQHERDRFIVQEDPVIDRTDARAHGVLDALGALRVCHHPPAVRGCFRDQGFELVGPEVGMPRVVARREHAATRGHLDDVGAVPDQLADLPAHLDRAVHDRAR